MLGCEATWAQAVLQDHVTHMGQKDFLPYTIITKGIGIVKQQIHFFFTPECNNHNNFFNYIELFSCHSYQQEVSPAQPEEASNMHALNRFGQRGTYALFKQAS